jgi:hypothetical protein
LGQLESDHPGVAEFQILPFLVLVAVDQLPVRFCVRYRSNVRSQEAVVVGARCLLTLLIHPVVVVLVVVVEVTHW